MAGSTLVKPSGQGSRVGAMSFVELSTVWAPACIPPGTRCATDPLILAERDRRSDSNVELVGSLLPSVEMVARRFLSVSVSVSVGATLSSREMVARLFVVLSVSVGSSLSSLGTAAGMCLVLDMGVSDSQCCLKGTVKLRLVLLDVVGRMGK